VALWQGMFSNFFFSPKQPFLFKVYIYITRFIMYQVMTMSSFRQGLVICHDLWYEIDWYRTHLPNFANHDLATGRTRYKIACSMIS